MKKKKLLLVAPTLHQGGLERACIWTARILEPYFEITIAVFDLSDAVYDTHGLALRDLRLPAAGRRFGKAVNVLRRACRLGKLRRELGTDFVYGFGPTANKALVLAGGPGRVWCGLHSYMDLDGSGQLPFILRRADKVICCSKAIAREVEQTYGCLKTVPVYNPYDREEILAAAQIKPENWPDWAGCKVIVTVGRADDVKGYWHLVKSFALVYRELPKTRLLFVGGGDFTPYEKLAAKLGLLEAVCFAGMQTNPFAWVAASDLFVLTSRNEGFPNAMVEAMILGKPVIAVNCKSGPAEILTDHFEKMEGLQEPVNEGWGVLIPEMPFEKNLAADVICREERLLAKQICALLADPINCAKLGAAAAGRAQLYGKEAYIEAFLRLAQEE